MYTFSFIGAVDSFVQKTTMYIHAGKGKQRYLFNRKTEKSIGENPTS